MTERILCDRDFLYDVWRGFVGRGAHTLAEVQSAAMTVKPVAPQGMPPVVSNVDAPGVEFGSTTHLLTIPAGYQAENRITVTLGSGLLFEATPPTNYCNSVRYNRVN